MELPARVCKKTAKLAIFKEGFEISIMAYILTKISIASDLRTFPHERNTSVLTFNDFTKKTHFLYTLEIEINNLKVCYVQ